MILGAIRELGEDGGSSVDAIEAHIQVRLLCWSSTRKRFGGCWDLGFDVSVPAEDELRSAAQLEESFGEPAEAVGGGLPGEAGEGEAEGEVRGCE